MKHHLFLTLAMFGLLVTDAAAQTDKTLTVKAGATDAQVLDLRNDGMVNITVDGNVIADCKPLATDPTKCEDIVIGPAGPPPNTTMTGTTAVNPDGMGRFPVGTPYTLQPRVVAPTTAEVCMRLATTAAAQATAWTGATATNLSNDFGVTLDTGDATYTFQYRCFNEFGASVVGASSTVTVITQPGSVIGDLAPSAEFQCDRSDIAAAVASSRPGFARQSPPTLYYSTDPQQRIYSQPFPASTPQPAPTPAGGTGFNRYVTVGFLTPPATWSGTNMRLQESQNGAGLEAYPDKNLITISTCPGDFRMDVVSESPEPAVQPTLAHGCRNFRPGSTGLRTWDDVYYRQDGVSQYNSALLRNECGLKPDRVYFLNIIAVDPRVRVSTPADPTDPLGVQAGENACGGQPCGMRSFWVL